LSFEIEQTLQTDFDRVASGNVLLAHESLEREEIEKTAEFLILNRDSIDELPIEEELAQNAVTGLFEKLTASGHLSHIEFNGDQEEVHLATIKRLLNAYDVEKPDWETKRNFQEICEELTVYSVYKKIIGGELPVDTIIITASDAPDESNVSDEEKHSLGYRMLNHKGMLRSYSFEKDEQGNWTRILEQVSRSNSNDLSTRRWFNENASTVPLNSTGGLSLQALASRKRLPNGVVSFTEELDGIYGTDRLYGETQPSNRSSYEDLRKESSEREEMLLKFSNLLYEKDAELKILQKSGKITYKQRLYYFYKEIDEKLIPRILINAPQFARDTYGEKSGALVEKASVYFAQGNDYMAQQTMQLAFTTKDSRASTGCGGSGSNNDTFETISSPSELVSNALSSAKEDKEDWTWTDGVCQVEACKTRPGKTKVGPCSVCRHCQEEFDKGNDPTKIKPSVEKKVAKVAMGIDIFGLVEKKEKNEQFTTAAK
jgi:hypothetical protein